MILFSDDICPKNNFMCANGKCVKASLICDSNNDCGDNSDETTVCSGFVAKTILNYTFA